MAGKTKERRTCPRNYYTKTPASVRTNRNLCCRVAASLNDTAADVRAGTATTKELYAAHNLAIAIGAPIKEDWYGVRPGEVEFDCDSKKLSTRATGRKTRKGGKRT